MLYQNGLDNLLWYEVRLTQVECTPTQRRSMADLHNMATPSSKKELQTFLEFIQFLAPFIPSLSEKSSVLRDLLKEDVPFMWESHHQASMDKIKQAISEESTLRY